MEHFRLLPSDPRLTDLSDEQIEILFLNYVSVPDDSVLKKVYEKKREKEKKESEIPVEDLREMGYTDEQIEEIKRDIVDA